MIGLIGPRLVDPRAKIAHFMDMFRFAEEKTQVEDILKARSQAIANLVFTTTDTAKAGRGGGRTPVLLAGRGGRGGRTPAGSAARQAQATTTSDPVIVTVPTLQAPPIFESRQEQRDPPVASINEDEKEPVSSFPAPPAEDQPTEKITPKKVIISEPIKHEENNVKSPERKRPPAMTAEHILMSPSSLGRNLYPSTNSTPLGTPVGLVTGYDEVFDFLDAQDDDNLDALSDSIPRMNSSSRKNSRRISLSTIVEKKGEDGDEGDGESSKSPKMPTSSQQTAKDAADGQSSSSPSSRENSATTTNSCTSTPSTNALRSVTPLQDAVSGVNTTGSSPILNSEVLMQTPSLKMIQVTKSHSTKIVLQENTDTNTAVSGHEVDGIFNDNNPSSAQDFVKKFSDQVPSKETPDSLRDEIDSSPDSIGVLSPANSRIEPPQRLSLQKTDELEPGKQQCERFYEFGSMDSACNSPDFDAEAEDAENQDGLGPLQSKSSFASLKKTKSFSTGTSPVAKLTVGEDQYTEPIDTIIVNTLTQRYIEMSSQSPHSTNPQVLHHAASQGQLVESRRNSIRAQNIRDELLADSRRNSLRVNNNNNISINNNGYNLMLPEPVVTTSSQQSSPTAADPAPRLTRIRRHSEFSLSSIKLSAITLLKTVTGNSTSGDDLATKSASVLKITRAEFIDLAPQSAVREEEGRLQFTYAELLRRNFCKSYEGLNHGELERHLVDEEFEEVFQKDKVSSTLSFFSSLKLLNLFVFMI